MIFIFDVHSRGFAMIHPSDVVRLENDFQPIANSSYGQKQPRARPFELIRYQRAIYKRCRAASRRVTFFSLFYNVSHCSVDQASSLRDNRVALVFPSAIERSGCVRLYFGARRRVVIWIRFERERSMIVHMGAQGAFVPGPSIESPVRVVYD